MTFLKIHHFARSSIFKVGKNRDSVTEALFGLIIKRLSLRSISKLVLKFKTHYYCGFILQLYYNGNFFLIGQRPANNEN